MQYAAPANITHETLIKVVDFANTPVYKKPIDGEFELALDALTRPLVYDGLAYVTLGRFVAGHGNVRHTETDEKGQVIEDYTDPEAIFITRTVI